MSDKNRFQGVLPEDFSRETGESLPVAMAHLAFLQAVSDPTVPKENVQRLFKMWDIVTRMDKGELSPEAARDELSHG